jgi:hypothetical protein
VLNALIVLALYALPVALLTGSALLARRFWHRKDRRNPLTKGLLRPPGYSLQERLEDVRAELMAVSAAAAPVPLAALSISLWLPLAGLGRWLPWVFAASLLGWATYQMVALVRTARDLRLGLEAEMAAGQELSQLMADGFAVFHDVPGNKKFNVDHVVVGRSGVFAVETKGRAKRVSGDESGYRVTFDQGRLQFPGWSEVEPLEQARRNAVWLGKWLTSAVGEAISAKPVLVLPGWFIERKSPADVAIINGTKSRQYFLKVQGVELSERLVKQIIHQLDSRCRDIEPRAYVHDD